MRWEDRDRQSFDAILAQDWFDPFHVHLGKRGNCGHAQRDSSEEPGDGILQVLVLCAFTLGILAGLLIAKVWTGLGSLSVKRPAVSAASSASVWTRLVARALRFVQKRRLVSLAFGNYSTYSLRNTEASKPTSLRRRRLTSPSPKSKAAGLPPLVEGPVVPPGRHGPHNR